MQEFIVWNALSLTKKDAQNASKGFMSEMENVSHACKDVKIVKQKKNALNATLDTINTTIFFSLKKIAQVISQIFTKE